MDAACQRKLCVLLCLVSVLVLVYLSYWTHFAETQHRSLNGRPRLKIGRQNDSQFITSRCPYYSVTYDPIRRFRFSVKDCHDVFWEATNVSTLSRTRDKLLVYAPGHTKQEFVEVGARCLVEVTPDIARASSADVVLLRTNGRRPTALNFHRPAGQIWVMQFLESPIHTSSLLSMASMINYTATYNDEGDLLTRYGGFEIAPGLVHQPLKAMMPNTSAAIWIASNCWTSNARRQLVEQIAKFYTVDIFGACGDGRISDEEEKRLLSSGYRYILSFENSNCQDYITEKVFTNAFRFNMVPIVYGAPRSSYEKLLPPNSFIFYQDFLHPRALAEFLRSLDNDDAAYGKYFEWKRHVRLIDFNIFPKLCDLFDAPNKTYDDLHQWWHSTGNCQVVRPSDLWKN